MAKEERVVIDDTPKQKEEPSIETIKQKIYENNQLRRQQIDIFLNAWVGHVNKQIHRLFIQKGLNYVPFKLIYDVNEYYVKERGNIRKRNLYLHVDNEFLRKFYDEKITFTMWLSQNHYEKAHEYYKYVESKDENKTAPHWYNDYVSKYNREVKNNSSVKQPSRIMGKDLDSNRLFLGRINETWTVDGASSTGVSSVGEKDFQGDISVEVRRFLEHEDYFFSDKMIDDIMIRSSTNSTVKYAFQNSIDPKGMKKILAKVLDKFVKSFETFKWNEVTTPEMEKTMINIVKKTKRGNKKYEDQYESYVIPKAIKPKPKFPNIQRIGEWFVNEGILKSKSLNKFRSLPISGKRRFLDRMIFHIANAIYVEKTGKSMLTKKGIKYKSKGENVTKGNYRKGDYKKSRGKSIRAKTMRTRSGQTPANDAWKKQIERWARGMNNRTMYRRGTLTEGATEEDFYKPTRKKQSIDHARRKKLTSATRARHAKKSKGLKGARKTK